MAADLKDLVNWWAQSWQRQPSNTLGPSAYITTRYPACHHVDDKNPIIMIGCVRIKLMSVLDVFSLSVTNSNRITTWSDSFHWEMLLSGQNRHKWKYLTVKVIKWLREWGGMSAWGWIRLNILPHNCHPRCANSSSTNQRTVKQWKENQIILKLINKLWWQRPDYRHPETLLGTTVQKVFRVVVWFVFEEMNENKHDTAEQNGSNTQPLTPGFFIVSGNNSPPFWKLF